jgi:hypothetical protein
VRADGGLTSTPAPCLITFEYPTDIVCLVVLWRLRYKLSLRDLAEMFLQRGISFTRGRTGLGDEGGLTAEQQSAQATQQFGGQELIRRQRMSR